MNIGRNDKCWCGSGKKYKSCHMGFDEKIKEFNDDNIINMKNVLSLDQDTDHVEKFIELKSLELVYQASIQVGAKLIQPTILDYIR